MKKFSSIEQFRNVYKNVASWASRNFKPMPTMKFRGTVKLHGTNAGVRRTLSDSGDVTFICQSRNGVKGIGGGHFGFPEHIHGIPKDRLNELFNHIDSQAHKLTIFGEWIGPGIQGGVGIAQLPEKQWVIYSCAIGDDYMALPDDASLENHNIYNISKCGTYEIEVDFGKPEDAMAEMERLTLEIEAECPWAAMHDIKGIGEGIVWTCIDRPGDSDLWFKTKGPKHSVSRVKTVASVKPEEIKGIRELVDSLMTESRMHQGIEYLKEQGLDTEIRNIGVYLKYIGGELQREEIDTIEASGFDWKKVWKTAGNVAKDYFIKETNRP